MSSRQPQEDRERELAALLEISRVLASNVSVRSLVQAILDQLKTIIDYTGASVVTLEPDGIEIVESTGPDGREEEAVGSHIPIAETSEIMRNARAGETMLIGDVTDGTGLAKSFQEAFAEHVPRPNFIYIRSWMCVPLKLEDRVVGLLSLSSATPGYFTQHHVDLAQLVARQAAVAAENARLFERTQAQTRELAALLEVSRALSSTLELAPLLDVILDQLQSMVGYHGASVMLRSGRRMVQLAYRRPSIPGLSDTHDPVPKESDASNFSLIAGTLDSGEAVIVDDVWEDTPEGLEYRREWGGDLRGTRVEYVHSFLCVPLMVRDETIGNLSVAHSTPGHFTEEHARLTRAFADQAAIAIENARLFEQTQSQARELGALLDVSRALSTTLQLEPLLSTSLDTLRDIVPYDGAGIVLEKSGMLKQIAVRRPEGFPISDDNTDPPEPASDFSLIWDPIMRHESVIIDDVWGDTPEARTYRGPWGGDTRGTSVEYVRSFLAVPLVARDRTVGSLNLASSTPGHFTQEHARLTRAFADQAALAIENAELFEQTASRTRELGALLEVSGAVVSTLDLPELTSTILKQLETILDHSGSAIVVLEGDGLVIIDSRAREGAQREVGSRIPLSASGILWQMILAGQAATIEDIRSEEPLALAYREAIGAIGLLDVPPFDAIRSWMGVPLIVKGTTIGMLTMSNTTPAYFTAEHAYIARAFADQAAIAIENARLFSQTGRLAAVEERQRLARELHDSVSQALYGIALGARTARTLLDREPAKASEPLDYVLSLAEAGLAEMRALIFELRPESLESEGLVAALEKQVAATSARYGIAIEANLGDEPDVRIEAKECLYRIGQEALHNMVKHARATEAKVTLRSDNGQLALTIADDGQGFDTASDFAGHLGLQSMRERAASCEGTLTIESAAGRGTTIRAAIPA